jgi:mannose-6-phosphate isomerase
MSDAARPRDPIKLRPTLHETIWGDRALARLVGKPVPVGARVGESWETEIGNIAENAPYAGADLGSLVQQYGKQLLGERAVEVFGERFPLLAKFLDAHDTLSVQVHPDDAYAREHEGGKLGKTEAWYILHAEPGAQLVYGLERPASPQQVREAIAANRLETLLHFVTVQPGDVVFVPSGTVHAIGAGIVLYELQEYSDVTYRLYDYGRLQSDGRPRELHIEPSLAVMHYEPSSPATVTALDLASTSPAMQRRALVGCRYFMLEEGKIEHDVEADASAVSCEIMTVLDGAVRVAAEGREPLALGLGETAVLPAGMGRYQLLSEHARFLRSYVPEEDDSVLRAWRAVQVAAYAR